jgi:nucleotide-binding universal stress UspA family protein
VDGRPIESVVVAYDGSEPARRALDRTAEIVRDSTVVTVVSVVPQRVTSLGPEPLDPASVDEHAAQLAEARAHLATRGVTARGVEGYGDPARVILEQAKEARADLVVVGSNDKSLVQRILQGSVSTELVHRADCDVLVVR